MKEGVKISMVALAFIAFLIAPAAWAVVGNAEIQVNDSAGSPAARMKVTLSAPGQPPVTMETGSSGVATFEGIEEGNYAVTVTKNGTSTKSTITVRPGETSRVTVSLPPISVSGSAPPASSGSGVSFDYIYEDVEDMEKTASTESMSGAATDNAGNMFAFSETSTADASRLAQDNSDFVHELNVNTIGGELNYTFGGSGGQYASAFGLRNFAHELRFAQDYGEGMPSGSRKQFYPAVSGMIGRADVEFTYVNLTDGFTTNHEGDGLIWGIGGSGMFFLCGDCNAYAGAIYKYRRISDLETTRVPAFTGPNFTLVQDIGSFDYDAHVIEGIVGYSFRRASIYGGVAGVFRKVSLSGDILLDFTQSSPGFQSVTLAITFTEEFEDNKAEGVAGIDFFFGRFIAGVEAGFNGENTRFQAKAGFGF